MARGRCVYSPHLLDRQLPSGWWTAKGQTVVGGDSGQITFPPMRTSAVTGCRRTAASKPHPPATVRRTIPATASVSRDGTMRRPHTPGKFLR
jgi:hypothetical protein